MMKRRDFSLTAASLALLQARRETAMEEAAEDEPLPEGDPI